MNLRNTFKKIWVKDYFKVFFTIWTLLVLLSMYWNLYQNSREVAGRAHSEAESIFQHNLAYRRWNALNGGVYVPIDETNRPDRYINSPGRDVITTGGLHLTLVNPFQMTRQAYVLLKEQSTLAYLDRTVSLNPLDPENAPDEWERKALLGFEKGKDSASEITEIEGKPYLRLLKPYVMGKECIKCHLGQGYKKGAIRGAASIAVPMQPYYEAADSTRKIIIFSHLLLWLLGTGAIMLLSQGLRKYQSEITENERKFRIVAELTNDFEFWLRNIGEITFISPACERITGYGRQEFLDRPGLLFDIVHPEDSPFCKSLHDDFAAPTHENAEFRIITKSGQQRWISHTCGPIYSEGIFLGRRGCNRDITDRKKLEEELFQLKKMESLGQFACGVAHDFNNILTSINGFAYLLHEEMNPEYLNQIAIASKLGKNLTSNLLAFGRKQISNPKIVKLNEIILNLMPILKTLVPEEIGIKIDLAPDELPILADPHQIEQVLINLCTNARDAMPEGGVITIRTRLRYPDKDLPGKDSTASPLKNMVLSFCDSGTGMDPEHKKHIFEPFFTTKEKDRGTGLGLSIVYSIIRQHKGNIEVFCETGRGTSFDISLPCMEIHVHGPSHYAQD